MHQQHNKCSNCMAPHNGCCACMCVQRPMARHLAAMATLAPQAYGFAPRTFVLPADLALLMAGMGGPNMCCGWS
jgi:hypothetical protein